MWLEVLIVIVVLVAIGASFVVVRGIRRSEPTIDPTHDGEAYAPKPAEPEPEPAEPEPAAPEPAEPEPALAPAPSFRERLAEARSSLAGLLGGVFGGGIDSTTWDDLEAALIRADLGVATATSVMEAVKAKAEEQGISDAAELKDLVKAELEARISGHDRSLSAVPAAAGGEPGPAVWLFVGVNGSGKTTTIGKLAARECEAGRSLVLAAGDTFRAAAAEQLTMWAERSGADIVRGSEGADPSSVVFDAVSRAGARSADLVLADTAGRLQNKTNLMNELQKVRRTADKGAGTVTETLLVLDAGTGQNGLSQARVFTEAVDVTGVVLTKLDGSAKGGIVVAIHTELGLPVKLVGLGEGPGDLVPFDERAFVDALFD